MIYVIGVLLFVIEILLILSVKKIQLSIASDEDVILISRSKNMYYLIISSIVIVALSILYMVTLETTSIEVFSMICISFIMYIIGILNFQVYTKREIVSYKFHVRNPKKFSFSELKYVFIEIVSSRNASDLIYYRIITTTDKVFEIHPNIYDINFDDFKRIDNLISRNVFTKDNYDEKSCF